MYRVVPSLLFTASLVLPLTVTADSPSSDGSLPAVSKVNAKVEAFAGNVNGDSTENLAASITIPVGKSFGVQLDHVAGDVSQDQLHGSALQAFWRDPSRGLLGLNVSHAELGGVEVNRAGLIGEYYQDRFTLTAEVGNQAGDIDDNGYASVGARFYATEDLAIRVFGSQADSDDRLGLDVEYQTAQPGLAFFAEVSDGDQDYEHVLGGVRYYFGDDKSLKRRHREDDPANSVFTSVSSTLSAVEESACGIERIVERVVDSRCPEGFFCINAGSVSRYKDSIDCDGKVVSSELIRESR